MSDQGRSVVRPTGRRRSPSDAVWSATVPAAPHEIETDETVAALLIVSPVEPVMPSKVAEIVTAPADTAVASPVVLIVAHVVSDEAQVA